MMLRTIKCGICGMMQTESKQGEGWHGWGQLSGAVLNGDENPHLCPRHKTELFNFADTMKTMIDMDGAAKDGMD